MNKRELEKFRRLLLDQTDRMQKDIAASNGQQDDGNLSLTGGESSNAPMHPGDHGTDEYLRDLNAALLENETYLVNESRAALRRIQEGTYGTCEGCENDIPKERLEALPYTKFCTACAEREGAGRAVNLNQGRPGYRGDDD